MKDYFTAIDEVAKEPYVNKDRLGCVGASFGGFWIGWQVIMINVSRRLSPTMVSLIWKCSIWKRKRCGSPIGIWVERTGKSRTLRLSVHSRTLRISSWTNGIRLSFVSMERRRYRIWLIKEWQRLVACAVFFGVPAELLIYPDENHWVLKPQNGVLWQRTFFEWLDMWLKK